jgi:hypothetical protein
MKESNSWTASDPFTSGPQVAGYSIGVIGFAIAFIGQFVLAAGIVLHIVAASRRKKLMNLPMPDARRFSGE